MDKLSKCGRFEIYYDKEIGYIAIKGLDKTQWLELSEWHDLVEAVFIASKIKEV